MSDEINPWTVSQIESTADIVDIVQLGELFYSENQPGKLYNQQQCVKGAARICASDRSMENAWLLKHLDRPAGFFYAVMVPDFGSFEVSSWSQLWYVRRDLRGPRPAILLVRAYEDWAHRQGAARVFLTVTAQGDTDVENVSLLFKRMGYTTGGNYHVKEH